MTKALLQGPDFAQWGLETVSRIQSDLGFANGLFGEEARPSRRATQPAYTWAVGVMMQALNGAASSNQFYRSRLGAYVQATRSYWNPSGPIAGYDVLPMPKPVDRYYDDNEWMVLALAEASRVLNSAKTLEYAIETFKYVESGEDERLGGGIYWRESDRSSKNTCSNGPAAAAALALYDATNDKAYLAKAVDLYAWTKKHLRDPDDGLYWDSIDLKGQIGKTKWSYNTALMLRAAADLYRITKREGYGADAKEMQKASLDHWVAPDGRLKDEGKFMYLLVEDWLLAYSEVPGIQNPRPAISNGLTWLHEHGMDSLGHYGKRWDQGSGQEPFSPYQLIDQASVARAYFQMAANSKR